MRNAYGRSEPTANQFPVGTVFLGLRVAPALQRAREENARLGKLKLGGLTCGCFLPARLSFQLQSDWEVAPAVGGTTNRRSSRNPLSKRRTNYSLLSLVASVGVPPSTGVSFFRPNAPSRPGLGRGPDARGLGITLPFSPR